MSDRENPKLNQIVSTSKSLFWKFGIKRVSIEEICQEANVSKMTFYKYFSNKNELVKHLLRKITEDALKDYNNIMNQEIPFKEKVKQSIQLKLDGTNELSQEFYEDLHKNADPEIMEFFNQIVHQNVQTIYKDYINAQKKGDIRKDIKPEFILYFLNHIYDMARDEQLIKLYESPGDLIMELTNFFFHGILPCK